MSSPSEADRMQRDLSSLLSLGYGTPTTIQWASVRILSDAMAMLQAQVLSRRALIGTGDLTQEAIDHTAREIQLRVERIHAIVAELRRRGVAVEWSE